MNTRKTLNEANFQQMQKFAKILPEDLQAELAEEARSRLEFEQAQAVENLQNEAKNPPLVKWALLALLAITLISGVVYWQSGRYQIVAQGEQMHRAFQVQADLENKEQKNHRYILSLQDRLRANPNNGDLWYELGQAYALNNDFNSALICFDNAQKVLGDKAAIFGAMATADYFENGKKITERARKWLDKALSLDKKESASLLLLASDAFANQQYQTALDYWRQALDSENESIDRRAIIRSMAEAQEKLE